MRTFHAQKDLKKKSASMFFWFSMLVHKTTDKTNFIDHQVIYHLSVAGDVNNHIAEHHLQTERQKSTETL